MSLKSLKTAGHIFKPGTEDKVRQISASAAENPPVQRLIADSSARNEPGAPDALVAFLQFLDEPGDLRGKMTSAPVHLDNALGPVLQRLPEALQITGDHAF